MNVAFRADAGQEIGTGHIMRCITLANALKKLNANIFFISRQLPDALKMIILDSGFQLIKLNDEFTDQFDDLVHSKWLRRSQQADAKYSIQAIKSQAIDWLIVDNYAIDYRWQQELRKYVRRIMVIDDIADRRHDCDILLDQNYYENATQRYNQITPDYAQLLLGPRYALLRDEFRREAQNAQVKYGSVKKILVNFGGVDADNLTEKALNAILLLTEYKFKVDVIVGKQHPSIDSILTLCQQNAFECHIQTKKVAKLIAGADLAVGAGGASVWERCVLGLPSVTIPVAHNQVALVKNAAKKNVLFYLPLSSGKDFTEMLANHILKLIRDEEYRTELSSLSMKLVDGLGVDRVVGAIRRKSVVLKPITIDYLDKLFQWRNHPAIRQFSSDDKEIEFGVHKVWFHQAMLDPSKHIFIASYNDKDTGVIRFDLKENVAIVSIYLIPGVEYSTGIGSLILEQGESWLLSNTKVNEVNAVVLSQNKLSAHFFVKNGYTLANETYKKEIRNSETVVH